MSEDFRKMFWSVYQDLTKHDIFASPSTLAKLPMSEVDAFAGIPLIVSDAVPRDTFMIVKRHDFEWSIPKAEFEAFEEADQWRYRMHIPVPPITVAVRVRLPYIDDELLRKLSRREKHRAAVHAGLLARRRRMAARGRS